MVAEDAGDDDAEAGQDEGANEYGDSWSELGEAPVQAELSEDPIGGEAADEEVIQDSEGDAFQLPKSLPSPKAPSREAVRRHNMTHWPYAPWCPHCVRARRNSDPHFQNRSESQRALPLLVLDYCFFRTEAEDENLKVLVGKLYPSRKTFACAVNEKGVNAYAVARLTEFVRQSGLHKFVYKCDQESSIYALVEEAVKKAGRACDWTDATVPENSAVGSSASNGRAERAVQMVEDQVRVLKAALEARIKAEIPC